MNPTLHAQIITLKKYQAWRTGKDARTMGEVGIKPAAITSALDVVITIAEDHLRDATKMIEPVKVPSDEDINAAWHELTGRACLPGSIAHASARALLAKYLEQPSKCSEVADIDYKAMYEQMCERCDSLDEALADERNAALDDAIAQCNALDNNENSENYRAGALWCAERIKSLKESK